MDKKSKKPSLLRRKSVWAGLIVVVASVFAYKHFNKLNSSDAPVLTEAVAKRDITRSIVLSGRVQPSATVDIGTQASGQIEKVHVTVGQRVKKGDLLVTLDPSIARNDVQQAQATLDQSTAQLDSERIELEQSRKEAQRQQRLFEGDAVTRNEADNAQIALRKQEADMRIQVASLAKQATDLAKAKLRLSQSQVFAPRDGEVLSIAVQTGQTVTASQTTPFLLTLANLDLVNIQAQIAEVDVLRVHVGQVAELTSAADRNTRHKATVKRLSPPASTRSSGGSWGGRSASEAVFYGVTLEVDNSAGKLLSEMSVQVDLPVAHVKGVLAVPLTALGERQTDGSYSVLVAAAASTAPPATSAEFAAAAKPTERKVRLGMNDSKYVEVVSGLSINERIVVQRASDNQEKKRAND